MPARAGGAGRRLEGGSSPLTSNWKPAPFLGLQRDNFGRPGTAKMACPEGLEPPTPSLEGWCSIQLSYGQRDLGDAPGDEHLDGPGNQDG